MGGRRDVYWVWWGDLSERDYLEDVGINGKIILKLVFNKWFGEALTGSSWLRIWAGWGCL